MHDSSIILMRALIAEYDADHGIIVDLGSMDVNGTYRDLFEAGKYIGADLQPGQNVDVIVGNGGAWELMALTADLVISGQTMEHVLDLPGFMKSIDHVLKPGGKMILIAPENSVPHSYPDWAGNFDAEQMADTVAEAGFKILEVGTRPGPQLNDTFCIAEKAVA